MNPVLLLVLLAFALAACKKPEAAAPPAAASTDQASARVQPPPSANGNHPGAPPPPDQVVVPATADMNETLSQLSMTLRSYVYSTKTKPRDFQDLVTRTHLQYPPPPAGKAYAIAAGKVVLVDQPK